MTFSVTKQDLDDWQDFFTDPRVNISPSFKPSSAGPLAPQDLTVTNGRFTLGQKSPLQFTSSSNSERFGATLPGDPKCVVLALEKSTTFEPCTLLDILVATGLSASKASGSVASTSRDVFDLIASLFPATKFQLSENTVSAPTLPTFQQKRNATWITSGQVLQVDTSLVFTPAPGSSGVSDSLKQVISDNLPIKLDNISPPLLIIQRTSKGMRCASAFGTTPDTFLEPTAFTWEITTTYRVTWSVVLDSFVLWISYGSLGCEISLTVVDSSAWSKIGSLIPGLSSSDFNLGGGDTLADTFHLLRITLLRNDKAKPAWKITMSISLPNGGPDIFLDYDSQSSTFSGGIVLAGFFADDQRKILPAYKPGRDIDAPADVNPVSLQAAWDLRNYFSSIKIPSSLPTAVSLAIISYQKQSGTFSLAAQARRLPGSNNLLAATSSPPSPFTWDVLDLYFTKSKTALSCSLSSYFSLHPPTGSITPPADLAVSFAYDSKGWELHGHAEDLSCGLLCSFFDSDSSDAVYSVLKKLTIKSLDLLWTHTKGGAAAGFLFTGVIDLGDLELRLFYQYATSNVNADTQKKIQDRLDQQHKENQANPVAMPAPTGTDATWSFECDLGASTDSATVGSIAESISEDIASALPSFVSNIPIPKTDGSSTGSIISLHVKKILVPQAANGPSTGNNNNSGTQAKADAKIVFAFQFKLDVFAVTFVQVADVPADKTLTPQPTKRLLRFTVDKLPIKKGIPLLDKLPQPFDLLEYVWINQTDGLTKSEVDCINNSEILAQKIVYKDPKTSPTSQSEPLPAAGRTTSKPQPSSDPVVLSPGHHFIVVQDGKVAIDHVFFASSAKDEAAPTPPLKSDVGHDTVASVAPGGVSNTSKSPDPSKPSKGAVALKLGPLSIDAVTLQFKEQASKKALVITIDATFALGPISFTLLGFGLSITLSDKASLNDLSNAIDDIDVVIAGMALSFNKPPLLVAGGFEHIKTDSIDAYLGGIGISFPPYTFVGLGEYAVVKVGSDQYKSVFLFAKLDGPLITLEFATITGVRLGLGFNSVVNSPDLDELTLFPFVNDKSIGGAGNDPIALLKKMTSPDPLANNKVWVQPKKDSYWFAAGLSITAFDILAVTAVAMLAFRDSGLIISIFADAIAEMPPGAPEGAAIVYVEIGMIAELNFVDGYFRVEASLAPTSYLLVPACRLYGGFALIYWFPPSEHAGDWVFSIGGYHRAYTPPIWYPVPRRLGISFNIDIISITGEAYFAVTPKCVMGGAMMHASLAFGPIEAWLDFTFDALVNFHPLHYDVQFDVSIGVRCNIDILFIHIHISVHVGANLHIQGPEFGGIAHVDFYLFGFDVDFGASPKAPDPLDLYQFFLMLHKPGPDISGDPSHAHESPLLAYIKVESSADDLNLLMASDAIKHESRLLIDTLSGAAFKYTLQDGNFPMPANSKTVTSAGDPNSTGAGSKWFVKGGSFQFQIATDYVLNDATLTTKDLSKPRHFDGYDASGPRSPIASRPMQLTPQLASSTDSSLTITVRRIITLNPLTYDAVPISTWRTFTLNTKPLPTAIWGSYDPKQDPSKVQRPAKLLDGSTDATVSQYTGITLSAPPPFLCPKPDWPGFIPKFRATAASRFGVLDFRTNEKGDEWIKPESLSLQENYLPRPLTSEENKQSKQQRWSDFTDVWLKLGNDKDKSTLVNDPANGLLATASALLGWSEKRPQLSAVEAQANADMEQATGLKAWQLTGHVPRKMVQNLKSTYLDLPRSAVVSATA